MVMRFRFGDSCDFPDLVRSPVRSWKPMKVWHQAAVRDSAARPRLAAECAAGWLARRSSLETALRARARSLGWRPAAGLS
jgi:hypothetical protein